LVGGRPVAPADSLTGIDRAALLSAAAVRLDRLLA
jgi:hypothetical protein